MGGRKRGRDISVCGPSWEPGLPLRHVPWMAIELATLCLAGRHSIHWATPARAYSNTFKRINKQECKGKLLKTRKWALTHVAQLVECPVAKGKLTGSIPGQGSCLSTRLSHLCFFSSFSPSPLSKKINKWSLKRKKRKWAEASPTN